MPVKTTKRMAHGQSLQDPESGQLYAVKANGEIPNAPDGLAERLEHVRVIGEEPTETPEQTDSGLSVAEITEMHWNAAKSAVQSGEADAVLGELGAAEDRDSVLTAIDERQETL